MVVVEGEKIGCGACRAARSRRTSRFFCGRPASRGSWRSFDCAPFAARSGAPLRMTALLFSTRRCAPSSFPFCPRCTGLVADLRQMLSHRLVPRSGCVVLVAARPGMTSARRLFASVHVWMKADRASLGSTRIGMRPTHERVRSGRGWMRSDRRWMRSDRNKLSSDRDKLRSYRDDMRPICFGNTLPRAF